MTAKERLERIKKLYGAHGAECTVDWLVMELEKAWARNEIMREALVEIGNNLRIVDTRDIAAAALNEAGKF